MSFQAQMEDCGVLCHLEVHPFIPAINLAIVHRLSTGMTTMDKEDLPRLFFVRMLLRCPDDVLRAGALCTCCSPSSQSE